VLATVVVRLLLTWGIPLRHGGHKQPIQNNKDERTNGDVLVEFHFYIHNYFFLLSHEPVLLEVFVVLIILVVPGLKGHTIGLEVP